MRKRPWQTHGYLFELWRTKKGEKKESDTCDGCYKKKV